jgi:hypothetical protein
VVLNKSLAISPQQNIDLLAVCQVALQQSDNKKQLLQKLILIIFKINVGGRSQYRDSLG